MYHGNVAMWYKFANSLKLRMGMVLADADNALAATTVAEAADKVIMANSENALFWYISSQPNNNPVNENLVKSGRNDFVGADTFINVLNDLEDPRRPFYYTTAGDPPVYVGGEYGASNDFSQFSHVADDLTEAEYPANFMDLAEVEFLLAEAVERGFSVGGSAEEHYNHAVEASIEYYGGTAAEAAAYLLNPKVAYATATGTWQEKIGMQKWIALYNRGFEAWTSYRILDFPVLVAPPDAVSVLPLRLTYPIAEQTLNGANRSAAASAIGGDDVGTKLFFDKN